jgi:lysophospholipase L1-like esterase
MLRAAAILGLNSALVLVSTMPGDGAATKGATKRAAPTAAAQRANALRKVDAWLNAASGRTIEQPGALVPFFERLYQLGAADPAGPGSVHIVHFGDSHTAADLWTAGLRDLFQQRFGNGGSGFSVAGHPFRGYRRVDARGGATTWWQSQGLRTAEGDGYFGLGGISISTERAGQSVFLDADCGRIEIHYLQQPGGGSVALYDSDQFLDQFSTDGELAPSFYAYDALPGPHRFVLATLDSHPVRLFGWVVDRPGGITYEALGINGAEASLILRWNESMLATYLQRRNPGLIVLAYGTNEATDANWMPETYQAMFSSLVQRLRAAVPAASILVVGPGDRWMRTRAGWRIVPGIDWVIEAQRAACRENGCAFCDLRRRTGGKGAIRDWFTAGLAQADRVHFTAAGYQRLASALFDDLMAQYEIYKKARLESDQAHGPTEQNR